MVHVASATRRAVGRSEYFVMSAREMTSNKTNQIRVPGMMRPPRMLSRNCQPLTRTKPASTSKTTTATKDSVMTVRIVEIGADPNDSDMVLLIAPEGGLTCF